MKKIFLVASVLSGVILVSCNSSNSDSNTATGSNTDTANSKKMVIDSNKTNFDSSAIKPDTKFVLAVADAGMFEVEAGTLALTKGATQKVKNLGQMMVNDHSKANAELKVIAASKNIAIAATLGANSQSKLSDLSAKSGKDFDIAFTSLMVSDHKDAISAFKKESTEGKDPEFKSWAAGKLSTLEHHLQMAKSAEDFVKNSK